MDIGEKIKKERKRLKMTQAELAKAIGAARVSLTDWENGKNKPKSEYILPLARELKVNVYWLLSDAYPKYQHIDSARLLGCLIDALDIYTLTKYSNDEENKYTFKEIAGIISNEAQELADILSQRYGLGHNLTKAQQVQRVIHNKKRAE